MPAGKHRLPTRKWHREGGDDDTQTRAHRPASGRTSPPLRDFSYSPRRAHEKSPQLSRENCGLTPKNAQLSREDSGILSPDSAPNNETAKAPNVNSGRVLPNASSLRGRRGVRRATVPLRLRATRLWAAAGRRDPRRSALPHSKAGKGAQTLRSTGGNSRYGSAARGAIRICVPTLGDFQGAWSRETRRCHTGAHALSRRRTRRLS